MRSVLALLATLGVTIALLGCEAAPPKDDDVTPTGQATVAEEKPDEDAHDLEHELEDRKRALAKKPDDAQSNHLVAFTYYKMGDLKNAREHWNAALAADPNHAKARFNLADVDYREGKSDDAVTRWQKVIELDASDARRLQPSAHYNIGRVEYDRGVAHDEKRDRKAAEAAFQRSIERYRKTLAIAPDHYKACINLGLALIELEGDEAAAKVWMDAVRHRPECFHGNYNLALHHAQAGRYKEAIQFSKQAIEGDEGEAQPDDVRAAAYYCLGEIYFDLGDLEESAEAFEESVELDNTSANMARQRLRAVTRLRARQLRKNP